MTLIELCENIAKAIELPQGLHVAAVFEDNDHDEIIGWRVLDSNNRPMSGILSFEELKECEKYRIQGTI